MRRAVAVQLLVVAAALCAVAAPASASTPVRARLAGGTVILDRSPLRLRVLDTRGRTVLRSVAGDRRIAGVRYAPLTLTVGSEPELRVPRLPGAPDPNPAHPAAARRYVATSVLSAHAGPGGMTATLRTSDPAGRRIVLSAASGPAGTIAITALVSGGRAAAVGAAFSSPAAEAFHGFGGRREGTDLRGRAFTSWVLDYRFPDVAHAYYEAAPQFVSSRGYGVLLDRTEIARWRMASDTNAWRVAIGSGELRLLVATGTPATVMRRITAITGRHRPAPAWSLRPTLSRTIRIGESAADYQGEVLADVARLERSSLPVGAYAFEGWATMPRDVVVDVIRRLRARGIHAILYLRAFASADKAGTEPAGVYADALAQGVVATRADGSPYLFDSSFPPPTPAALIDFSSPQARIWWTARIADLLDTGADGFMNDFGEQVLPDMHFADGETGATFHNRFPAVQAQVTRGIVSAYEAQHPGRKIFFFQRAGWEGADGSAGAESATFPGDESADWNARTGLPSIVPDMLNRATGGAYGFTTDIGGYADFRFVSGRGFTPVSPELFTRWAQASVFMTHFRVHNSALTGVKLPWSFDPATQRRWAAAARLHERAMGLIERTWRTAKATGMPVTRPLWLVMPGAAASPRANDEWLLGADLLAAPVLREHARSRPVLLPPGCWRRAGTGPALRGARTITARASLDQLPWYVRCGTHPLK